MKAGYGVADNCCDSINDRTFNPHQNGWSSCVRGELQLLTNAEGESLVSSAVAVAGDGSLVWGSQLAPETTARRLA